MLVPSIVALVFAVGCNEAELSAKPGGKMSFVYNPPTWRDEFKSALQAGQPWRFGANGATTWTTEAGILFDDLVVFPGEYNIAGIPQSGTWQLVFHHDGIFYERKQTEGMTVLQEVEIPPKEQSKQLEVVIAADKKADKGVYLFQATFGPRRIEGRFRTAKAKVLKAKAGKKSFTSTWLERTDVESLVAQVEAGEVAVARIQVKDADHAILVFLRGGDSPRLRLVAPGEAGKAKEIPGQKSELASAGKSMVHSVAADKDALDLSFEVGAVAYHFPLAADVLDSL